MELKKIVILRDEKGKFIKGGTGFWFGKKIPKEKTKNMHKFPKGNIPWNKDKTNVYSKEIRKKMSESHIGLHRSIETKRKLSKANRMDNHPQWKGGISFELYTFDFDKELRELIRKRDNYKCQICGMPECENIKKLCVHHIDYIKKNCSPNNLISLCSKCHLKTNHNRNYWKDYFKNKGN